MAIRTTCMPRYTIAKLPLPMLSSFLKEPTIESASALGGDRRELYGSAGAAIFAVEKDVSRYFQVYVPEVWISYQVK